MSFTLTKQQAARLNRDRDIWLQAANILVEDRNAGQLVPYRPNRVQRYIYERIDAAEREGRPFLAIGLKSRRHGFSTAIQAEFNRLSCVRRRFSALTIAHEADASSYLFRMTETMRANMHPDFLVPKKRGLVGRHLELANDALLDVATAGDRESGRATGRRAVHASEAAFWPDLSRTLLALRQIVPPAPGTMFVIESTANGMGTDFHREFTQAQDNKDSDYEALFFPWWWDQTLRKPAPAGMLDELDAEEQKLAAMGVDPEQLAWRRWAIQNLCGGSLDQFHQEYPATSSEAFLASGRLVFAGLDAIPTREPRRVGEIVGEPYRGGGKLRFVANPRGPLRIFDLPDRTRSYVAFVDPMGEPRDEQWEARPEREKQDYACIQVVDAESCDQVAVWHGRIDEAGLAREAARLGYLYSTALVAVERGGGYGTLTAHLLSVEMAYPRLYREEAYGRVSRRPGVGYGWRTSEVSRPVMVAALRDLILERPEAIRDEPTLGELRSFVVLNGKPQAAVGCHDDRVMALAGALAVRLRGDSLVRVGTRRVRRRGVSMVERAPRPKARVA